MLRCSVQCALTLSLLNLSQTSHPSPTPFVMCCHHCVRKCKGISRGSSDSHDSILRMTSKPALENLMWDRVWQELLLKTPLLAATLKSWSSVCASIILKLQNQKVNVVQTMISRQGMPLSRCVCVCCEGVLFHHLLPGS